jgi:hypothetical protein
MATTIKEFLIGLGFRVDPAQQNRFTDALKDSHQRVEALGKTLTGMISKFAEMATAATGTAIGLAAAMAKISENIAGAAYAADRIGTTTPRLKSFEEAIRQVGGTAERARGMLEGMMDVEAHRPGTIFGTFGIKPGTDPVEAMRLLSQHFAELIRTGRQAQAFAEGEIIHLTRADILQLTNPLMDPAFQRSMGRRNAFGIGPEAGQMAEESDRLIKQLHDQFNTFLEYLQTRWGPAFNEAMRAATKWFDENIPKIKQWVSDAEGVVKSFIETLKHWWDALSPAGKTTVETIGVILVLRALSALPIIGLPILLASIATAIVDLVRGYNEWKATGVSSGLVDWTVWGPQIENLKSGLTFIKENVIDPLTTAYKAYDGVLGTVAEKLAEQKTYVDGLIASYQQWKETGISKGPIDWDLWGPPITKANDCIKALVAIFQKWQEVGIKGFIDWNVWGPPIERITEALKYFNENAIIPLIDNLKALKDLVTFSTGVNAEDLIPGWLRGVLGIPAAAEGAQQQQEEPSLLGKAKQMWRDRPGWLGGSGGGATDERKADIRDRLVKELGIPVEAASGLVSNLNAESGIAGINERNPVVPGSRGGFGWAQWTGPRRVAFENWARAHGLDPASDQANMGFLVEELRNKYPQVLAQLKSGQISATEAAKIVSDQYIVPPKSATAGHVAAAASIAKLASAANGPSASLAAPALVPSPVSYNTSDQSRDVQVNAPTNININGVADPQRAADLTDRQRDRQTANLLRQMKAVIA